MLLLNLLAVHNIRLRLGYNYLVGACVLVKYGLLTEVLAALATLIRLFTGVDAQVLVKYSSLAEEARTVHAAKWFLIGVDAQVLREMRLLSEPLSALRARIRPRFNVDAAMLQKGRLLLKLLVTDGAANVQRHVGRPYTNVL